MFFPRDYYYKDITLTYCTHASIKVNRHMWAILKHPYIVWCICFAFMWLYRWIKNKDFIRNIIVQDKKYIDIAEVAGVFIGNLHAIFIEPICMFRFKIDTMVYSVTDLWFDMYNAQIDTNRFRWILLTLTID